MSYKLCDVFLPASPVLETHVESTKEPPLQDRGRFSSPPFRHICSNMTFYLFIFFLLFTFLFSASCGRDSRGICGSNSNFVIHISLDITEGHGPRCYSTLSLECTPRHLLRVFCHRKSIAVGICTGAMAKIRHIRRVPVQNRVPDTTTWIFSPLHTAYPSISPGAPDFSYSPSPIGYPISTRPPDSGHNRIPKPQTSSSCTHKKAHRKTQPPPLQ